MNCKLILCEKPSVTAEISHVLGAYERIQNNDGVYCYKGNGYYITNALGHLYGLGEPSDYGYSKKNWSLDELPILPKEFKILPITVSDEAHNQRLEKQRNLITELMNRSDDNCNHRAGRVKTPLLNIIVNRELEIQNFVKTSYYKLALDNGAGCTERFPNKEYAENAARKCSGAAANVTSAIVTEETENRPYLHNLTSLQKEANDIYGLTAAQTLKAAQSLYESKRITYPRTDSKYISDDMLGTVSNIITALSDYPLCDTERVNTLLQNGLNLDKRVINNDGISDHHAILPTTQINSGKKLSADESNILGLVINRFLSALDKPYKYQKAVYEFWVEDYTFKLTTKSPIELGWKRYKIEKSDNEVDENNPVIETDNALVYVENSSFGIKNVTVKACEKKPPNRYNDSTLLSVMENICNLIDDKGLRGFANGKNSTKNKCGLGTSATRAAVIDELIANQYIGRKGKSLYATPFGIEFIQSIPESVKSIERTAEWEQILESISRGDYSEENFLNDVIRFVTLTIESEKQSSRKPMENTNAVKPEKTTLGVCPRCKSNVYEGRENFYCERGQKCGFTIWKQDKYGYYFNIITADGVIALLSGKSIKLKKKTADGTPYTGDFLLDDTGIYANFKRVAEEKKSLGICPRCKNDIVEGKINYYCKSGKNGCGFGIWKQYKIPAVSITARNAMELLSSGVTSINTKKLDGTNITIKYSLDDVGKYVNLVPYDGI